jgi:hypothetical protein
MKFNELYKLVEEGSAARKYSCLMLDLSEWTSEVEELHESICPCEVYDDEPGHGLEKEFHVTVKYGIHDHYTPQDIYTNLDLVPVKFKFKGISLFQNDRFDVLKFDIMSKDLHDLNSQVSDTFECTDSFPNYHPHATIAYLKPGTGKYYTDLECDLIGKTFTSNRFIFSNPNSEKVFWTI